MLALAAFGAVSVWGASDEEPAAADAPSASSGIPVASTAPVSSDAEAVELRVESVPEGAKVSIDGEPRGTTPITFELARGEPVVVEVVAAGRVPHRQTVRAERDQTLVLELASRPEATTRVPPPRARTLAPPHPVEPKPPPEPSMAERVHDYLE